MGDIINTNEKEVKGISPVPEGELSDDEVDVVAGGVVVELGNGEFAVAGDSGAFRRRKYFGSEEEARSYAESLGFGTETISMDEYIKKYGVEHLYMM